MTVPGSLSTQAAETLRSAIAGEVFLPGHPGYDEACRAWVLTTHERPAVVVLVTSATDVAEAVKFARARSLRAAGSPPRHRDDAT